VAGAAVLWALDAAAGAILLKTPMSAGSNAPVSVDGDYVIAGAGAPLSPTQRPMIIADKLGAHGTLPDTVGGQHGPARSGHIHPLNPIRPELAVQPELSVVYAAEERAPFARREAEHRAAGVPAVADPDDAIGQARHFDAVAGGETEGALHPERT
jgi:hypothetical protein